MAEFPYLKVSGSPRERGLQYGSALKEKIKQCYELYFGFFASQFQVDLKKPGSHEAFELRLRGLAEAYESMTSLKLPTLAAEIAAIAESAGLPTWKLYALNARTEIACGAIAKRKPTDDQTECTVLVFPEQKILAQTWDWHPDLEGLMTVVEFEREDGHRIVALSEPGIIGKFGLNSAGLGVLVAIMFGDVPFQGIPIHLLLRVALECRSVEEAFEAIRSLPRGTTSSISLLDRTGQSMVLELQGENLADVKESCGFVHTNHYVAEKAAAEIAIPGSVARHQRARELYQAAAKGGVPGVKLLLADTHDNVQPICRSYGQGAYFPVGTVAGVIIDVQAGTYLVLRGQPHLNALWQEFSFR